MNNWLNERFVPEESNSGAYQVYLDYETTQQLTAKFGNRLLARLNDLHEFHCAINLKKDQTSYIQESE